METIALPVTKPAAAKARDVRAQGKIPAVYYGAGVSPQQFAVDYEAFRKTYRQAGKSTLVNLQMEGSKELPVLIHDMQFDPKSDRIIHVDFLAVDLHKTIHAQIPLVLTGVAPAVKELAGVLVQHKSAIQVSCLPKDLVHEIAVDVTSLVDFHKSIKVRDVLLPAGITALDAPEITVATVAAPRAEEVEVTPAAVPAEGAAPAEGGAAPAEGAATAAPAEGAAAPAPEKGKEKKKDK